MSLLSDKTIEQVRDRTDLLALVEEHVQMKRSGAAYKGLCPFHDERTPSFYVTPSTKTWKCFGCDEGGDAIDFVQQMEGGGFRFAVEFLANRANIPLETVEGDDVADSEEASRVYRNRLHTLIQTASEFFSRCLLHAPEAEVSRTELLRRGIDPAYAAEHFGCGHSPSDRNLTLNHLRRAGFTDQEIIDAGMATRHDSGNMSTGFRGRMMWTINNAFGRPIGFGARRMLDTDTGPKFLNTAETALYKKSTVLFGYSQARKSIAKNRHALVVEGYTDVVACHLAGVQIAVAACGTAFTETHRNTLRGVVGESGEITFGLDDDSAGHTATLKVYDLTKGSVARLTALTASDGKDPDEYRQAHGDEALRDLLERREPLLWSVIRSTVATSPQVTDEDRLVALNTALPLVSHAEDPLLRSQYGTRLAEMLGFDPREVLPRIGATPDTTAPVPNGSTSDPGGPAPGPGGGGALSLEREIVSGFVNSEATTREFARQVDALAPTDSPTRTVLLAACAALTAPAHEGEPWQARVARQAQGQAQSWVHLLALEGPPVSEEHLVEHTGTMIERVRERARDRERAMARQQLMAATTPQERAAAQARFLRAAGAATVSQAPTAQETGMAGVSRWDG